jgi:hypothetical protein
MAFKYTLGASMDLRASIPPAHARALEYLVCGVGSLPTALPEHAYGGVLHWANYQGRPVPYRSHVDNAAPNLSA